MSARTLEDLQGLRGLFEDLEEQPTVAHHSLRRQGIIGPRRDGILVPGGRLLVLLPLLAVGRQGQLVAHRERHIWMGLLVFPRGGHGASRVARLEIRTHEERRLPAGGGLIPPAAEGLNEGRPGLDVIRPGPEKRLQILDGSVQLPPVEPLQGRGQPIGGGPGGLLLDGRRQDFLLEVGQPDEDGHHGPEGEAPDVRPDGHTTLRADPRHEQLLQKPQGEHDVGRGLERPTEEQHPVQEANPRGGQPDQERPHEAGDGP